MTTTAQPAVPDLFAVARVVTTTRRDGDFARTAEPQGLAARRRAIADLPWAWVNQVHGADVVVVDRHDVASVCGRPADALVTAEAGIALEVRTADCAPVALASAEGVIGVAHAGWRGVTAGVVEATVAAMRALGATAIAARIGPCIGPECYEFGAGELDQVAARYGDAVRGTTAAGAPALDVAAAVMAACRSVGVHDVLPSPGCTACDSATWFSHRARGERERLAMVIWRPVPER